MSTKAILLPMFWEFLIKFTVVGTARPSTKYLGYCYIGTLHLNNNKIIFRWWIMNVFCTVHFLTKTNLRGEIIVGKMEIEKYSKHLVIFTNSTKCSKEWKLWSLQTQETQLSPRSDLIRDGSVFVMERKKFKTFGIENNILLYTLKSIYINSIDTYSFRWIISLLKIA